MTEEMKADLLRKLAAMDLYATADHAELDQGQLYKVLFKTQLSILQYVAVLSGLSPEPDHNILAPDAILDKVLGA